MTAPEKQQRPAEPGYLPMPETRPELMRQGWLQKRREKVREEVERNRRGEYTVPTWVFAVLLAALIGGWLLLIFLNA